LTRNLKKLKKIPGYTTDETHRQNISQMNEKKGMLISLQCSVSLFSEIQKKKQISFNSSNLVEHVIKSYKMHISNDNHEISVRDAPDDIHIVLSASTETATHNIL